MALWPKDSTPAAPAASHNADSQAARPATPSVVPADVHTQSKDRTDMKESVIAAGLIIEGKIIGTGHVRVAGKFKGDVQVEGNLHIDVGAKVEGQVRASEVTISGELQGNIEAARRVDLQQGGSITGDVKAGTLTVAAGSRMRGQVEFGWEDSGKVAATDIKGRSSAA